MASVLLVLVALIALLILVGVGAVHYFFATKQSIREIARDIEISSEWCELRPQPALRATKHVQDLIILTDGYRRTDADNRTQIPLPDGTTAGPEVLLVDERGNDYPLHASLLIESGVGYTAESWLLRGKSFPIVKLRCDKPFRASKIFWQNMKLK